MASFWGPTKRRKKSPKATLNKLMKKLEEKKVKGKIESIRKQLRGF